MDYSVTLERHDMKVTVKELTVADIRAWLKSIQELTKVDVVDAALFQEEGASIDDVLRMTDLDAAEIDQLTPAEVAKIIEKCRKVNPHFFRFRAEMVEIGGKEPAPTPSGHSFEPPSRP